MLIYFLICLQAKNLPNIEMLRCAQNNNRQCKEGLKAVVENNRVRSIRSVNKKAQTKACGLQTKACASRIYLY